MVTRYKYSPQFEKVKFNSENIWSKFFGKIGITPIWVPKMNTFSIRKRRYIDNPNPLSGNGLRLCFVWKMLLKVLQQQDSFSSWNQCNEIWESLHQSRKSTIFERSAIKVRESVRFVHKHKERNIFYVSSLWFFMHWCIMWLTRYIMFQSLILRDAMFWVVVLILRLTCLCVELFSINWIKYGL